MIKKLMLKIYERKLMRHILKGERIIAMLNDWGCEGLNCTQCKGAFNHCCGVHDSMIKWNNKIVKFYEKYAKYQSVELLEANRQTLEVLKIGGEKLNGEEQKPL